MDALRQMSPDLCGSGRVVLLQGLALAESLYAEPACRQMGDIDLYLPDGNAEEVRSCLRVHGFEKFQNYRNVWYRKGLCIDLHESLWGEDRIPRRRWLAPEEDLLLMESRQAQGYYVLGSELMTLECLFHGLKHGFGRAIWILDALMLWRRGFLNELLIRDTGSRIAVATARYLSEQGLIDRGELSRQALRGGAGWWRIERTALAHGRREGAGEIALAFLCPSVWKSIAYLWCSAFPPRRVLREMYGGDHDVVLPVIRVWVLIKLLLKALR
ncbi:MAG: hypothetical protein GF418_15135 [Chitinivibrionales bacterium]|nr:hypothetical protein [Chitinivibrionales bacterium]MBD3396955.1 hypothetical protein [Chitinivibrionales bacterium]